MLALQPQHLGSYWWKALRDLPDIHVSGGQWMYDGAQIACVSLEGRGGHCVQLPRAPTFQATAHPALCLSCVLVLATGSGVATTQAAASRTPTLPWPFS